MNKYLKRGFLCYNFVFDVFLLMFVAGCGVCKRMQPIFQQAATEAKGQFVSLIYLLLHL